MIDAERVVLTPINFRLNVRHNRDFVDYLERALLDVTLEQGEIIEVVILSYPLPFFVEAAVPDGEVTIAEGTNLVLSHEFRSVKGMQGLTSIQHVGDLEGFVKTADFWIIKITDHNRKFEAIVRKLEAVDRRFKVRKE